MHPAYRRATRAAETAAAALGRVTQMEGGPVTIELVEACSDELVEAFARLLPQLSTSAAVDRGALQAVIDAEASSLFVARLGRGIVGMATLVAFPIPTGLRCFIEDVVVDEPARRAGVGAALVDALVAHARRLGARNVDLTSRPTREAANRLYLRKGFVVRDTNVYRLTLDN